MLNYQSLPFTDARQLGKKKKISTQHNARKNVNINTYSVQELVI